VHSERHNLIDAHVGSQIRKRRTLLGMTQERLGDYLGLTFQQVQKYERGSNRVSASRLYDLSLVLGVSIPYFFDNLPAEAGGPPPPPPSHGHVPGQGAIQVPSYMKGVADHQNSLMPPSNQPRSDDDALLRQRDTLELVRAFHRIAEPTVRKRIYDLMKSMGPQD
jgi:DNA-binding XRE family transcriptional regulator